MFVNGLMIDSSVAASTLFLIRLLTLLIQVASRDVARRIHVVVVYLCFSLYFFINLVDIVYFEMFDSRLNILFVENIGQMGPIFQTIVDDYPVFVVGVSWLLVVAVFAWLNRLKVPILKCSLCQRYRTTAAAAALVILAGLSFLWVGEPFWRTGAFSVGNQALNQLSLNGVYTLAKAFDQMRILERDSGGVTYQFSPAEAAIEAVHTRIIGENEEFVSELYPFARKICRPMYLRIKKPNVVIILMEGFSASYIGVLNADGSGCSPGFDTLCANGILFSNFYGHETRTHHGLVSTVGSFPSLLGMFLTRRRGTESFYTLGTLLKQYGYSTSFIYGYDQGFDHMGFFMKQGGFDLIIDQADFPSPRFKAQWGVSDEDLFDVVNNIFSQQSPDTPFFSVVLTSSNHTPHEVPKHFLRQHPEYSDDKLRAAFAYSDYALQLFFKNARREPYFRNTIFIIVADHGEIRDPEDRYLKRFHIPCLIYAPHLIGTSRVIATVAGQIDIGTTLMHLIGFTEVFHFVGRNLLAIPEDEGFAVMRNNHTLYYRVGNSVLVRDIRDTLSTIYLVDSLSRMRQADVIFNDSLKRQMNHELECYLQTLHHIFSTGKHRCGDSHRDRRPF
jgi:phosphoglycerol transferase MdoB-like AlkP superfamily enzyme